MKNEEKTARLISEEIQKSDIIDVIKKDKDFEKKVKEICSEVIKEMFRVLWIHNSIFKSLSN